MDTRLERAFLAAPGRPGRWRTTSLATERSLLRGTHPLSPGLTMLPHVVYRAGRPVGRCALILPVEHPPVGRRPERTADPSAAVPLRSAGPDVGDVLRAGDRLATGGRLPERPAGLSFTDAGSVATGPDVRGTGADQDQPGPAFVGFFECVDSQTVADELFAWAQDAARRAGRRQLVGPVDASFWLGYRMKMDRFTSGPYFGEPSNPSYHPRLWAGGGWQVAQRYSSTIYRVPPADYAVARYEARLADATARGYRLEPLDPRRWDEVLGKVHALVMRLYADMPYFHPLSVEQFTTMFSGLRQIAPADLTTLVWREADLAGFSIVLPDYGDLPNRRLTPATLGRIWWTRRHHRRVVAAYMGAAEPGLGSAMAWRLIDQARVGRLQVIGSLIAEGTLSQRYAPDIVADRHHYALWSKAL